MKKVISLVLSLVLLVSLVLLSGCQSAAERNSVEAIKKAGKLVVYTEAGFAPFEFISGGKVVGVDIAIAEEIAKELGVELEVQDVNFNSILAAVESGKCAIGAAGITITDERKEQVDFSVSYATSQQYIIVPADNTTIETIEDLAGLRIGTQLGTTGDFLICDEISGTEDDDGNHVKGVLEGTGATVSEYANANIAATQMASNKLDAVVIDKLPAQLIVANSNGAYKCFELVYEDGSKTDETYGLCVAKGNESLAEVINTVLNRMKAEGKIEELIVHYSTEVQMDDAA